MLLILLFAVSFSDLYIYIYIYRQYTTEEGHRSVRKLWSFYYHFIGLKCHYYALYLCSIYMCIYIKCIVTNKYESRVLEYNNTNSQKICA